MVMDSDVAVGGKREFGGAQFELTVKLSQMAEDNLIDFYFRRDASCLHGFLSRQAVCSAKQRHQQQEREAPHRLLLYYTAEQRDELAALHLRARSITSSARASSVGGTSRPRALAVLRLITSSYLVGACTGRSAGFSPLNMRST